MLTIKNLCDKQLPLAELKEKYEKILAEKKVNKKVFLYLVDNKEIQRLNKEYLGKNKPTNVISFPYNETNMLGEIFISVPYCEAELEETGFSLEELISFYFVHGFLHLLGYEHVFGGEDEIIMEKEQERLFKLIFPEIEFEK